MGKKDVLIKYLPNTTTKEEIKAIRAQFNKECNTDEVTLVLIISGKNKLLDCLQSLISVD